MIVSDLIAQIFYAYRGKTENRIPTVGSEKYNLYLAIANRKKNEWATDPNNRWQSCFEIRDGGTISTSTLSYDLDDDFYVSSDFVRVVRTDGSLTDYPIVTPQRRDLYDQSAYITGRDPKTITFAQTMDSGLSGGTLQVPGYYIPEDMVGVNDTVPVDDPNWLVYITASELARNDPAKEDQYPALLNQANDIYRKMVVQNTGGGFLQPMDVPNAMPMIGGIDGAGGDSDGYGF